MLTVNVVRLPAFADAVNVNVAMTEVFGATMAFCRFQARVRYVLVFEGVQLVVVMLRVTGTVPVFFR